MVVIIKKYNKWAYGIVFKFLVYNPFIKIRVIFINYHKKA
jgi:hypothetical protein